MLEHYQIPEDRVKLVSGSFYEIKCPDESMDFQDMFLAPENYVTAIDRKRSQKYIDTYVKKPGTPNKMFIEVIEETIR